MTLFEVKGWELKQDKIVVGGVVSKKKAKKEKKEKKRQVEAEANAAVQDAETAAITEVVANDQAEEKLQESKKRKADSEHTQTKKSKTKQVEAPAPIVSTTTKLTPLQQKMMAKLSGSRFRWINEQLYTISSESALELIKSQPSLFDEYHAGFRSQVAAWPENPVDVFVKQIKTRATTRNVNAPGGLPGLANRKVVVADMGCGEAQLSLDVSKFLAQHNKKNKRKLDIQVHSFDLKKHNERITVADIKNVPLPDESCTIVIFCLAMMGTNFLDFVNEAYRILAPNGELWIAEIKSRFTESGNNANPEDVGQEFVDALKLCGFFHKSTDNSNKMFSRFEFFKPSKEIIESRNAKLQRKKRFIEQETDKEKLETKRQEKPEGEWLLKPCIYKRR